MTGRRDDEHSTLALLLKLFVFTVCVPGSVTVWLPFYALFPAIRHRPIDCTAVAVGVIILITAGAIGYLWCALEFTFRGKGTPAPIDMPRRLVAQGLYRYTRNPMYLSVLSVLVGESALFRSLHLWAYAAVVALLFHLFVLLHEEPTLRRKMGAAYEQYCKDVPRWIPRVARKMRDHAV